MKKFFEMYDTIDEEIEEIIRIYRLKFTVEIKVVTRIAVFIEIILVTNRLSLNLATWNHINAL